MCDGAGTGDGSTSITPPGSVGPRLVLLRGGRRELLILLCCQEPSSWAFRSAGLVSVSPQEKGWSAPGLLEMLGPGWSRRRGCKCLFPISVGGWLDTGHRDVRRKS